MTIKILSLTTIFNYSTWSINFMTTYAIEITDFYSDELEPRVYDFLKSIVARKSVFTKDIGVDNLGIY